VNARAELAPALASAGLPGDDRLVASVAFWAYSQTEKIGGQVWLGGRDDLGRLDPSWRTQPFPWD
jgi:hypothetical protein